MEFSVAALQGMVTRFSGYATLETGFQLVVIAVELLVGMTVHGMSDRRLSARLERGSLSMPNDFLMRMFRRLVFPLSALLVVLATASSQVSTIAPVPARALAKHEGISPRDPAPPPAVESPPRPPSLSALSVFLI